MDDLKHRMKEWWEYDPGHIIPQALARIEALEARVAAADKLIEYLERWQAAAFMVYGNLDLDIEANPEARAIAEGKDDE